METKSKNVAPVGSMWIGKDANGASITVRIDGEAIEGNDLRAAMITSLDFVPSQETCFIGKTWFRRSTRIS